MSEFLPVITAQKRHRWTRQALIDKVLCCIEQPHTDPPLLRPTATIKYYGMKTLPCNISPLTVHRAVETGDYDTARELLADGTDVNAKGDMGWTPLRWAVRYRHIDVAKLLLDHGADVNACDKTGKNIIYWELYRRGAVGKLIDGSWPTDLTVLLLDYGADPTIPTDTGATGLQIILGRAKGKRMGGWDLLAERMRKEYPTAVALWWFEHE